MLRHEQFTIDPVGLMPASIPVQPSQAQYGQTEQHQQPDVQHDTMPWQWC